MTTHTMTVKLLPKTNKLCLVIALLALNKMLVAWQLSGRLGKIIGSPLSKLAVHMTAGRLSG